MRTCGKFDTAEKALLRLHPDDVLTAHHAHQLVDPCIVALPPFDDSLLPS